MHIVYLCAVESILTNTKHFSTQGLKKPYNPIIGERFRCYWKHQETGTRTFFVAEQLSHHPPISGFYVANRQDGFVVNCCILAKSKFYGKW
jgi:hypothetical protein